VIAIDTSALIAIFRQEPEAETFLTAIVRAEARALSAVSLLEASMVMSGGAISPPFAPLDAFLAEADIELAPFDAEQASLARVAFLRFGKGRHRAGLNFGDCAAYALAMSRRAPLLYKGDDFPHTDIAPAVLPSGGADTLR
jgi:ribonuclease VapC